MKATSSKPVAFREPEIIDAEFREITPNRPLLASGVALRLAIVLSLVLAFLAFALASFVLRQSGGLGYAPLVALAAIVLAWLVKLRADRSIKLGAVLAAVLALGLTGCGKQDPQTLQQAAEQYDTPAAKAERKQLFHYEDPRKGVHFQGFNGGSADFKKGDAPASAPAASKGASQ